MMGLSDRSTSKIARTEEPLSLPRLRFSRISGTSKGRCGQHPQRADRQVVERDTRGPDFSWWQLAGSWQAIPTAPIMPT